jgi:ubiquinone/menaquinone biosynthesis C-methylase UbiE
LPASADPQGLAFDALAEDYDLGRAGWPSGILDGVRGEAVLDLGAGTGKLTALLVRHYPDVTAVEPLAGMRVVLVRQVPRATVIPGNAERIPLDDCSVDAVFVAEAFHWFDSHAAGREVARVLRPGGTLLVCFNEWSGDFEPRLPREVRDELRVVRSRLPTPGVAKVQSGEWRRGIERSPFRPLEERSVAHTWTTGREGIAAYYASTSAMGSLPADERLALRERLLALLPDVAYRLPIEARVYRTRIGA